MARMKKRKPTTRRKTSKTIKKKLIGFTKTKGKYALVFSKGKKKYVGTGKYKSKSTLAKAAQKYL